MFKKGLVTLVCLTVLSAVWAFATAQYSVSTKINSLGTGGTIKTRIGDATVDKVVHTEGTQYTIAPSTDAVHVTVTPLAGYKITSVTTQKYVMNGLLPVLGTVQNETISNDQLFEKDFADADAIAFPKLAGRTQFVVATFAPIGGGSSLTWQLQVQNNNSGGTVKVNRGTAGQTTYLDKEVYLVGKPWIKNFNEAGETTITVTAGSGYVIDYIVENGVKTFYGVDTKQIKFSPTATSRIKTFNVGYKKNRIQVTTQTATYTDPVTNQVKLVDNGIAPMNPVADPYGNVRLIVTPVSTTTAVKNQVTDIDVTVNSTGLPYTGKVTLTDRFGAPASLPFTGPVKVLIEGLTEAVTVSASYGTNLTKTAAVQSCTNTCHVDPTLVAAKSYVKAAGDQWAVSAHAAVIDCVGCHQSMPGPQVKGATCATCHTSATTSKASSFHATASGHATGTCQRCHTGDGARNGAEIGWTGGYTDVLSKVTYTAVTAGNGIGCNTCHNAHNGELLAAKTIVNGALVAWNPNGNASTNDQYDVCTSCHTLTDNTGKVVGNYHDGGSVNVGRTISDSHFDNAATGTTAAGTTIEGYALRTTGANPCADCHNLHGQDLTVQEQWAKSGHAGQIATVKADAAAACAASLAWYNGLFPAAPATACTDMKNVIIAPNTTASNRTVQDHFNRNAAGIAYYSSRGATDATGVAWTHYNWDQTSSRGTCQRCHTATGSANFLNNPAGYDATGNGNDFSHLAGWTKASGSAQQELLYCWGCHSDAQTGALRNPGALTLDYSTVANDTVTYPDFGASNVCVACHSGMGATGNTIKNTTGDFNALGAIQPHYLAAAGVLAGRTGYEFSGVTYTDGYHKNLGVANFKNTGTSGPCVACHMSGAEKHTFEVGANAVCANCHEGLTNEKLEEAKTEYNAAVAELNAALKAKGIWFIPNYPYFVADNGCVPKADGSACESFDAADANNGSLSANEMNRANGFKKWEDAVPGTNGAATMGAAFNYNLLVHEPGAFAHNRTYAYQLIASSIDFLNDGLVSGSSNVVPANKAKELLADETHINVAAQDNVCSTCHAPGLPAPATSIAATLGGVHAVGQAEATPTFTVNGDDLDMTFTAKVDGADATGYAVTRVYRYFDDSANGRGWVSFRYSASQFQATANGAAFTVKVLGAAANSNSRYYVRLEKAGAAVPRIASVGNYPASPVNDLVSNQACTNCHGNKIPVHEMNPLSFEVCVVCHGADNSTTGGSTYSASTYPKLGYLLHGVHASEKVMPSGEFVFKPGAEPFKVAYPTYMNNCSVCHTDSADLTTVTAKPVSYSYCMTCHENFTGFDHGNTVFGGTEHAAFDAATDCSTCHAGKTVNDFHNGLLTERSGVIWNGVDTSVTEGAKINTTINSVERVGNNLKITWSATMDGTAVDPCYGPSDAVDKPSWKNANNTFSVLRAYSQGDDWGNAGISTSPGQPASTNLAFGTNTVCSNNVATTTIALTAPEVASTSTKIAIALQGKVNLFNANTGIPQGVRAKTAYQAYNFQAADGVLTTTARRDVTDTNSCLKCHTGSLYQHGGNRIDSMELCVMCHNENSSEQNVRLLDGVDSTEAYDGKVGQTYGFKTLLHAIHSAGENNAITMVYRTNGNYVFTGEEAAMPAQYPTGDVFADDAKFGAESPWFVADDNATLAQEVGTGSAALIFGSSAAHGTGSQTAGTPAAPKTATQPVYTAGTQYQVYRAHNIIRVTYPQDLKNCVACHKSNGYAIPGSDAIPTVVDAGTVGLGGTAPAQTASNAINSNIADDLVIGATTAACMSCHNANATLEPKKKAWLDGHASKLGVARGALAAESCTTCHKP